MKRIKKEKKIFEIFASNKLLKNLEKEKEKGYFSVRIEMLLVQITQQLHIKIRNLWYRMTYSNQNFFLCMKLFRFFFPGKRIVTW